MDSMQQQTLLSFSRRSGNCVRGLTDGFSLSPSVGRLWSWLADWLQAQQLHNYLLTT
jgi:hypothetical protein